MSQYSAFSLLIASMSWRTVRRFSSSALSTSAPSLVRQFTDPKAENHGSRPDGRKFNPAAIPPHGSWAPRAGVTGIVWLSFSFITLGAFRPRAAHLSRRHDLDRRQRDP